MTSRTWRSASTRASSGRATRNRDIGNVPRGQNARLRREVSRDQVVSVGASPSSFPIASLGSHGTVALQSVATVWANSRSLGRGCAQSRFARQSCAHGTRRPDPCGVAPSCILQERAARDLSSTQSPPPTIPPCPPSSWSTMSRSCATWSCATSSATATGRSRLQAATRHGACSSTSRCHWSCWT